MKNGGEMAEKMLQFVNSFDCDSKGFAQGICRGHRTLQQSVMRLFVETIHELSQNGTDERNENAVMLAKEFDKIANEYPLPLI